MTRILLSGGHVVDPDAARPVRADVLVEDGVIVAVGEGLDAGDATVIDAAGRFVLPGLIDAHSHTEGAVFDPDVQLGLLRQGVTTVIGGQDGVSYAPGGGEYASWYFAAINGEHPDYVGPRVADLLAGYDGRVPVNVAYTVPAGTVRHEVMGAENRPATEHELAAMVALVAEGLADGAVGVSTGLDYTPGLFADADEIAAVCAPLAGTGLPYVSHMRGGYEENARVGVEEAGRIGRAAGVGVHLSHFHTRADLAHELMEWLDAQGVSASYDAYPYTRGCSIMGMMLLPPELNALPPAEAVAVITDPEGRDRVRREWFPKVAHNPSLGQEWPDLMTIGHTPAPEFSWAPGLTLRQVAERRGTDPIDAALDLMAASNLAVNVVMGATIQRSVEDLGRLFSHPAHLGGSDGIFIGQHPHPRARGTFAAFLGTYVREHGFWDWPTAVRHLSRGAARRFRLGERGMVRPGAVADLILVDPDAVADTSTYPEPLGLAVGIDDVLVAGVPVLAGGRLTGALPGGGLRAAPPAA